LSSPTTETESQKFVSINKLKVTVSGCLSELQFSKFRFIDR
jgi:hypothetical protein